MAKVADLFKNKNIRIADHLRREQKALMRSEVLRRNQSDVVKGILDRPKAAEINKSNFFDLMKTTLGNEVSPQGLLRQLEPQDLQVLARKANALRGKYQGGIRPSMVINSALPIDRQRASDEIMWSHPTFAKFDPKTKSLIITFTTDASGRHRENKHFVTVQFCEFDKVTGHWLTPENPKEQANEDLKLLKDSLIKFDCDCGRHTYWYRFIATTGDFAYVGSSPIGRSETGFPKIRNPHLNGLACKHVLRTMQAILKERGTHQFIIKAILKQYKVGDSSKSAKVQTTKRDFERSIKRQMNEYAKGSNEVLSDKEKALGDKLRARYKQALKNGILTRSPRDKRTGKQKLATLAKVHDVDSYLKLIE